MRSKRVFVKENHLTGMDLVDLRIHHPLYLVVGDNQYMVVVSSITTEGVEVYEVYGRSIEQGDYYLFPVPIKYIFDEKGGVFSKDTEGVYYFNNDTSISLYFNAEGNVVLENNENTIVFPPYTHNLFSALTSLCSTKEDTTFYYLFEDKDTDKEEKEVGDFLLNIKKELEKMLPYLMDSITRKYEKGFIKEEVEEIRAVLEKVGADTKKFDDALCGITVSSIDGQTIYYPVDVMKAMQCAIEKRDLKAWEWD